MLVVELTCCFAQNFIYFWLSLVLPHHRHEIKHLEHFLCDLPCHRVPLLPETSSLTTQSGKPARTKTMARQDSRGARTKGMRNKNSPKNVNKIGTIVQTRKGRFKLGSQ